MNKENSNIYFTSDSHYSHVNITGAKVSNWKSGYRNFDSVEDMNNSIVDGINSTIPEDGVLYHLGDFAYGIDNVYKFRGKINCKTVHLILGNHDKDIRKNKNGIQSIFNSVQDVLHLKTGKYNFFLSHYAHLTWPSAHRGTLHLFGHSHNRLTRFQPRSMDVGIDVAYAKFGEYRPFSMEEIIELLDKQKLEVVDHHSNRENK